MAQQQQTGKVEMAAYVMYLTKSIMQERLCPDLLQYQQTIVVTLQEELKEQEQRLEQFIIQDTESKLGQKNFKYSIYKLEIERLSYLIKSYLRVRLFKIQKYAFHIIKFQNVLQLLSDDEQEFVRMYSKLRYDQYQDQVLKDLHKDFRGFDGVEFVLGKAKHIQEKKQPNPSKQMNLSVPQPDKSKYTFFKTLRNPQELRYNLDVHVTNVKSEERMLIQTNDIIFTQYGLIEPMYQSNMGELM